MVERLARLPFATLFAIVWLLLSVAGTGLLVAVDSGDQSKYARLVHHGVVVVAQVTRTAPSNHDTVYYTFVVDGRTYASSDATNAPNPDASHLSVGDPLHVVYDRGDPRVSCACDPAKLRMAWWQYGIGALWVTSIVSVATTFGIRRLGRRWHASAGPIGLAPSYQAWASYLSERPSPGWYSDPWKTSPFRWWDGTTWTETVGTTAFRSRPAASRDGETDRFVGGMNVPSRLGYRLNTTVPLAVLTIGPAKLTIHPRPFPIPMFTDFQVALSDIARAFPVRGNFLTAAVGIELSDGQLAYFWTLQHQHRVLVALARRGAIIDSMPRRPVGAMRGQFAWLWQWTLSPTPSVAQLPGLSRTTMVITPISVVVGITLAIWMTLSGKSLGGWVFAAIGLVGAFHAARMWIMSRR